MKWLCFSLIFVNSMGVELNLIHWVNLSLTSKIYTSVSIYWIEPVRFIFILSNADWFRFGSIMFAHSGWNNNKNRTDFHYVLHQTENCPSKTVTMHSLNSVCLHIIGAVAVGPCSLKFCHPYFTFVWFLIPHLCVQRFIELLLS